MLVFSYTQLLEEWEDGGILVVCGDLVSANYRTSMPALNLASSCTLYTLELGRARKIKNDLHHLTALVLMLKLEQCQLALTWKLGGGSNAKIHRGASYAPV